MPSRFYVISDGVLGVLSLPAVSVWTNGRVLWWRDSDGGTAWPAADAPGAARRLAEPQQGRSANGTRPPASPARNPAAKLHGLVSASPRFSAPAERSVKGSVGDEPDTDRVSSSMGWPTCAWINEPARELCRGVRAGAADVCWAHLSVPEIKEALRSLEPGGELDLRGTSLSKMRLRQILAAMRDPGDGRPRIGNAQFDHATFMDGSSFKEVVFTDRASFDNVTRGDGDAPGCCTTKCQMGRAMALGRLLARERLWPAGKPVSDGARRAHPDCCGGTEVRGVSWGHHRLRTVRPLRCRFGGVA